MTIIRLVFLFAHVVAFAVALGCVLREDVKLLSPGPLDTLSLQSAFRLVGSALAILWLSGLALILLDTGGALSELMSNAKLLAKLLVVSALTANGVALHLVAFPNLLHPPRSTRRAATIAAILGAISSVSWTFATLLGISRGIAKSLTFELVVAVYGLALAFGSAVALILVRPIIQSKMRERSVVDEANDLEISSRGAL